MTKTQIKKWKRLWYHVGWAIDEMERVKLSQISWHAWTHVDTDGVFGLGLRALARTRCGACTRFGVYVPSNNRFLQLNRCYVCNKYVKTYYKHENAWGQHLEKHNAEVVAFYGGTERMNAIKQRIKNLKKAKYIKSHDGTVHRIHRYYRSSTTSCDTPINAEWAISRAGRLNCMACIVTTDAP